MAHKIKITLNNSEPLISRTVLIPEKFTFYQLSELIQTLFGWDGSHLYEFNFGNRQNLQTIAPSADENDDWAEEPDFDDAETEINEILPLIKKTITYTYDFGDNWEHTITFMAKPKEEVLYPVCQKAEGFYMIDDCGGVWGFTNMLNILNSTNKEDKAEKEEYREWLGLRKGKTYETVYAFDIEEVNEELKGFC